MIQAEEVIEMATKHVEPDQDSWKQQERIQIRRRRSRKLGAFAVAAAIALIALVVVVVSSREASESLPAADQAISPPAPPVEASAGYLLDLETGDTTPLPSEIMGGYWYDASPDGTMITFDAEAASGDREAIWVVGADGADLRAISPDGADGFGPRWFPDGYRILYQEREPGSGGAGNLVVVDVATGETTQITDLPQRDLNDLWFLSASVSSDFETVLYQFPAKGDDTRNLWSIPMMGGNPTLVREGASYGAISPDGTDVAFLPTDPGFLFTGTSIQLAPLDDAGAPARTIAEGRAIELPRWSPDGSRIAYADWPSIYVIDVETGETSLAGDGFAPEWVDDHTLLVRTEDR